MTYVLARGQLMVDGGTRAMTMVGVSFVRSFAAVPARQQE